ncbi:hypothetical protein P152DRAFT_344595 [Eremomyces bilateralis CBS 781.70]|uniref:Up-regulated during septation protein 1 domain-containing protein n=1 Tax=Eremomyces bilateralis CBS 781.70 TaxID=1392243 RepID=A0A6G1G3Q6_9PEZI|nr:uncharacterized protein P152DRAFT_344595 [Eremomyces bilateralis CBS 781.70]KAF1812648.1 hypothetical protein P152DRAFT_344595 [Eremomyces bilateralis CBS 781.70]
MTHIANCLRHGVGRTSPDNYIVDVEALSSNNSTARSDLSSSNSPSMSQEMMTGRVAVKYQLWPNPSRPSQVHWLDQISSDKSMALSAGRSSTSLSDTVVANDNFGRLTRSGSLARRRKISVPELGPTTMTMVTVRELAVDSPTIPGRPPLRTTASESHKHERSASAPGGNWRHGPFGDAMVDCVGRPFVHKSGALHQPTLKTPVFDLAKPLQLNATRPLSPILSPPLTAKPVLKLETGSDADQGPPVPPKPSPTEGRGSPVSKTLSKSNPCSATMPPATRTRSPPFTAPLGSSKSMHDFGMSPMKVKHQAPALPAGKLETPVCEQTRPVRRSSLKKPSNKFSPATPKQHQPVTANSDSWKLPEGMIPQDALKRLPQHETESLRKQARGQAEKFEVLGSRNVASLSRELRALDERCEYLRRTYKSLRDGRQTLHVRMLHYLKSDTLNFSRERLLKQSEALLELDQSIDDWILKLEQAENRRLRVRQKLLEHVAAAVTLNQHASSPTMDGTSMHHHGAATPPGSPVMLQGMSPHSSPHTTQEVSSRRDVESIKIYADGQVLSLFNDIDQAMTKMCEAC